MVSVTQVPESKICKLQPKPWSHPISWFVHLASFVSHIKVSTPHNPVYILIDIQSSTAQPPQVTELHWGPWQSAKAGPIDNSHNTYNSVFPFLSVAISLPLCKGHEFLNPSFSTYNFSKISLPQLTYMMSPFLTGPLIQSLLPPASSSCSPFQSNIKPVMCPEIL